MKPSCVTIQMKAIEQYFHVVLFIMLNKVVLTCELVDQTLLYNHLKNAIEWCFRLALFIML